MPGSSRKDLGVMRASTSVLTTCSRISSQLSTWPSLCSASSCLRRERGSRSLARSPIAAAACFSALTFIKSSRLSRYSDLSEASIAPCARRNATRPSYEACRWRSSCLTFLRSCGPGGIGTLLPASTSTRSKMGLPRACTIASGKALPASAICMSDEQ
eukprot:scaffold26390_cov39-Phaeocystis_antarctica.AAC.3